MKFDTTDSLYRIRQTAAQARQLFSNGLWPPKQVFTRCVICKKLLAWHLARQVLLKQGDQHEMICICKACWDDDHKLFDALGVNIK